MNNISLIIERDKEDIEAAEVLVDGQIGGNKYRFLLDTGSAITSVKFDDYTKMFKCIEKKSSYGLFSQCNEDIIRIPSIKVGQIVKKDIAIARSQENIQGIRNLIGMDILKDYKLYFSFEKNIVTVDENHEFEKNLSLLDMELSKKFHPFINVYFRDIKTKAIWDTGAGITIVDTNFIKRNPQFFKEIGQTEGTDSTGTKSKTATYIMKDVRIGNYQFESHKVAGVDLSHINSTNNSVVIDMILGYTTLSKADWYFDFQGRKWAIVKINS